MRRSSYRRPLGFAIVAAWLVMAGWLAYRELGPGFLSPDAAVPLVGRRAIADDALPRDSWMGFFAGQEQVGWVHVRESAEEREGAAGRRMDLETRMTLNLLGRPTELGMDGEIWRGQETPRLEFQLAVGSGDYDFRLAGTVSDGALRGEVTSAGETVPLEMAVDDELVFAGGFGTSLEFPDLDVGDEVRLESFDPLTLTKSPMRLRCTAREPLQIGGRTLETRRLHATTGGLEVRVWIDEGGEVVQAETPLGLVLRRIEPQSASLAEAGDSSELLRLTAVEPRGKRPFRGARRLVVRVTGGGKALPEDAHQTALGDGRYLLTQAPEPSSPVVSAGMEEYLGGDLFVQSEHPKIRAQATEITAGVDDPWRRAVAIYEWVYQSIEKEPVVSVPSALEVLEKRRGDCNEHTVLFTALARAAGIPSRIAIGLVWSETLDGFYYHAWPEVYVGEWTAMDPTLGQPLADATHVKILNGGIERWTQLLPYLGQVEIEVLEME